MANHVMISLAENADKVVEQTNPQWRGGRARFIAHVSKACRVQTLQGSNPCLAAIRLTNKVGEIQLCPK